MEQTTTRRPGSLIRLEDVAWFIDAEFKEMPGMRLTFAQVKRLWNLSDDDCRAVLDYLVSSERLSLDDDGRIGRQGSGY
jgi:hypothetical protein